MFPLNGISLGEQAKLQRDQDTGEHLSSPTQVHLWKKPEKTTLPLVLEERVVIYLRRLRDCPSLVLR